MGIFFGRFKLRVVGSTIGLIALMALPACANPERKVARRIDMTPEIIRQSSNLFAADRELLQFPITVDGFKGAMRIRGSVATEAQKSRAEKIVWAFPGVQSVQNELEVNAAAASGKK